MVHTGRRPRGAASPERWPALFAAAVAAVAAWTAGLASFFGIYKVCGLGLGYKVFWNARKLSLWHL